MTKVAMVEPQTISSIFGASEKWSITPAKYIVMEVKCGVVNISARALNVGQLRGETARLRLFGRGDKAYSPHSAGMTFGVGWNPASNSEGRGVSA